MGSEKRKTSEHVRVPSTVPNDYDHLGVPGSLDIPLNGKARRRRRARRRGSLPGWVKALMAMSGGALAFAVVALIIGAIFFPPFFRDLEPRYQQRIIDMFPVATYLKPTVPFEVLPTLGGASDSDAAQQLLLTQIVTPTATPTLSADATEDTGTPPTEEGGIPIGMAPTTEPTGLPTFSPTTNPAAPAWTPVPQAVVETPIPAQGRLYNIRYEEQNWNNCGPTTMTMALSYYGWLDNQFTAAKWMKPHSEDKNVSPWQMVRFVNENTGVKALYRIGGNINLIKRLIAAGFPVVIEEGFQPAGEDWMGHYLLVMGYDDLNQVFLAYDSYLGSNNGQGRTHPYSVFDQNWRHFNRVFMVIYEPSREPQLRAALGDYADTNYAARAALETARAEAAKDQEDKWAWFNMGSSYVALGEYDNAAIAFDRAFQLSLPWRMLWYQFGPYEAYYRVGRYQDVLNYAEINRNITPFVEETYYWEGMVYAAQGKTSQAVSAFNTALKYNKNFFPAQEAKAQVESGTFQVAAAGQ